MEVQSFTQCWVSTENPPADTPPTQSRAASIWTVAGRWLNQLRLLYKSPHTRGLTHQRFLLTVLEPGSPSSRPQIWGLVRNRFLVCRWPSSHGFLTQQRAERERPQTSSSLYKSTSPIHEGSIPMTYHPCKCITFKYHDIGDLSFNI